MFFNKVTFLKTELRLSFSLFSLLEPLYLEFDYSTTNYTSTIDN